LKLTVLIAATLKSVGVIVATVNVPAVAVKNMFESLSSRSFPDESKLLSINVEVVAVESGLVKPDTSIWKKVPAESALFKVTFIVRVALLPVQEAVIEGGSIIVHERVPVEIDVVGGRVISSLPPEPTAVIVVDHTERVVLELTVFVALWTPTDTKVAELASPSNKVLIIKNTKVTYTCLRLILNSK
jgi:hypothetical protein